MAIHGTRIYRSVPGRALIEVTDLDGVVTDALSYEEAQGEAGFLDCNGDYLCVATASGHLRFWRLRLRRGRPRTGARPDERFHDPTRRVRDGRGRRSESRR